MPAPSPLTTDLELQLIPLLFTSSPSTSSIILNSHFAPPPPVSPLSSLVSPLSSLFPTANNFSTSGREARAALDPSPSDHYHLHLLPPAHHQTGGHQPLSDWSAPFSQMLYQRLTMVYIDEGDAGKNVNSLVHARDKVSMPWYNVSCLARDDGAASDAVLGRWSVY